jgi:hypothetical protein
MSGSRQVFRREMIMEARMQKELTMLMAVAVVVAALVAQPVSA